VYKLKYILILILYLHPKSAEVRAMKTLQGILFKQGSDLRLGSIDVSNKRTKVITKSNIYGVFNITVTIGDTLVFSGAEYNSARLAVNSFDDKIVFLAPNIHLAEVVIKENSLKQDLLETQDGYRKKSVFYTGTPHYYYLFLKPMTFIYENVKSEVKEARKFKKFTHNSLNSIEITKRWNNEAIKANVPIDDKDLEDFRNEYWPTIMQVRMWSDYDLINYIRSSYREFSKKRTSDSPDI